MPITLEAASHLSLTMVKVAKLLQSMRQHAPRLHPAVDLAKFLAIVQGPIVAAAVVRNVAAP